MPVSFVLTGRVINSVGSNPFDTQRLVEQVDQVGATCMQPASAGCTTRYGLLQSSKLHAQQDPNTCLRQLASCCLIHRLRCNAAPFWPRSACLLCLVGRCQH